MNFKTCCAQACVFSYLAAARYFARTLALDQQVAAGQQHEVIRGVAAPLPDHAPMLAAQRLDAGVQCLFNGGLTHLGFAF